ncbi:PEP-CTERM-box response regulator transcription factor [Pseudodesulfovibrio cashew]|uniref:PEP-CTERM-box response regulator transcription factor n=1 Tax=Pseudodesulfovibrio cashew TaxID=2678688 RepID=A0A6I6JDM6_9BACT|nr:PEP-CTERM-box response regulator transcription factor [Pseudodesulfovibrio cashew]QGY39180.1 PEP-CTERM-box response regulator transcription factor [Pseudodesulfovibrio cashew]
MQNLLIVDDNDEIRRQLKWGLSKSNYELIFARDGVEGLNMFKRHSPPVVTLDLGLPPNENGIEEGLRCLGEMLRMDPTAKIIVITGNEEKDAALQAVRLGAYDYYKKPVNLDELKVMIDRAMYLQNIESENQELRRQSVNETGIVGECPAMQAVFTQIDRVAASDVPVLVCGESGTGKELVARAIHKKSLRAESDMIPINCGAIPENLLESELFGYEKGAFTGANKMLKGKVEYADKGTLFLDEIGEMPMTLQVKLLRFLQEMMVTRVGGRKEIPVDVRIITATNIDIQKAMEDGSFREDLFYRIGVMTINLPPLRERGGDIELLANYFLKSVSVGQRSTNKGFSQEALDCIKGYDWPGNIRELENRVKRAVIMATGPEIMPEDLGMKGDEAMRQKLQMDDISLKEARLLLERDMVERALDKFSGNIVKAAASIGVSRPTFYDLMKKHGLKNA